MRQLNQLSSLTKLGSAYDGHRHAGSEVQGLASKQARRRQEERFNQQTTAATSSSQLMSQLSPSHLY